MTENANVPSQGNGPGEEEEGAEGHGQEVEGRHGLR